MSQTLVLEEDDILIQFYIKDMPYNTLMFAEPQTMFILKNNECWLDPNAEIFPVSDVNYNRILGITRDTDNKYVVCSRNLPYTWTRFELTDIPEGCYCSIKQLSGAPPEVLEML